MKLGRVLVVCALASALSCASSDAPVPRRQNGQLAAGLAAKVGGEEIALSTVTRIARAQHLAASPALDRAISDALFAAAARSDDPSGSALPTVERAAWARALLEGLKAEALARGPITDAEVAQLTALRWQDLDRPETVRTTHAVARVEHPEQDARARAVAQAIWEAERGVTDPREFIRIAQAVPHEGIDVRAEQLPPVTRDGRIYYPEGAPPGSPSDRFDSEFASAAAELAVGHFSEPKKTVFGYHVILCEARLPAQRLGLEERRAHVRDEALDNRADHLKQELLARLNAATPTLVTRAVDDLTARVQVIE
jgi:hypothetical protein